jgi:DNA-binding NtrC family response regulator
MCEEFGAVQASQGLKRAYQKAAELGSSDHAPVLVVGEDGTGKELLAHAIHIESLRCGFPFVPVSGHLPSKRLEEELFGSPEGFHPQGGKKKVGRLQQADGGTLYIRCIEEMERSAQVKLARFLARQELKEVGGEDRHSLNVRVIAGARTELKTVVRQGKFLEELYRHLSSHVLPLSPLRDSPRDIVPLATHFSEQFSREYGKRVTRFDVEAQRWLKTYAWPGNLRELRSIVERAVLLSEGGVLSKSALNSSLSCEKINLGSIFEDGYLISLDEMEKLYIHTVLKAVRNNKTKASKVLGVSRNTLKSKLAESGSSSSPRRRAASRRRR